MQTTASDIKHFQAVILGIILVDTLAFFQIGLNECKYIVYHGLEKKFKTLNNVLI